jgi:hypothetical protein
MKKEKMEITPLQARMLQQFWERDVYNPDAGIIPGWLGSVLGIGNKHYERYPLLLYSPEKVLNALQIKKPKDRNEAIEEFYGLVKKDLVRPDKDKSGYFMTSRGVRFIKNLSKGKLGELEKYSSENTKNDIKESGLEKLSNAAALIITVSGILLIISKLVLTGAVISTNSIINQTNIAGILLIIMGVTLFILKKK